MSGINGHQLARMDSASTNGTGLDKAGRIKSGKRRHSTASIEQGASSPEKAGAYTAGFVSCLSRPRNYLQIGGPVLVFCAPTQGMERLDRLDVSRAV